MNCSEMTDFEINKAVFEKIFGPLGNDKDMLQIWTEGKFQPLKSWADAGPIIQKNSIGLSPSSELWHAYAPGEDVIHSHSNPLRAAMIVFLMMQDK